MQKKIAIAIAVLFFLILCLWYFTRTTQVPEEITLYGNVDIRQVSLAFENSERVMQMLVNEGDVVKAGQLLAVLNTQTIILQMTQAQAQIAVQEQALLRLQHGSRPEEIAQAKSQLNSAQANLNLANTQLKRLKTIAANTGGKAISQQEIDNAQANVKVAQADVDNRAKALELSEVGPRKEDIDQAVAQLAVSKAQLALLQHNLAQAKLKSPVDAVVRARLLEPGDMASPVRPVYTLAITSPKWIRAYVNEEQLGYVKPGMKAQVTTDSYPDTPISGQVGYISSVAEFTPKTVETTDLRTSLVYEIRVMVDDPENRLRLGMPATINMSINSESAAA